jgi:hypothetical protein
MNSTTHNSNADFSNADLQRQRQRLETLVQPAPQGRILTSLLTALGERTVKFLTTGNELRVWQRDRNGRTLWFAHDPITNRTRSFHAEEDLRSWLDSRYYE